MEKTPAYMQRGLHINISDCYDYLEKLFTELEDFAARLQEYLRGEMSLNLQKRTTAILAFLLEIIGRSEKIIRTGRFKQFLSANVFGNDKMKQALDRLKDLIDGEGRLAAAITFGTTRQIGHATQQIGQTTMRTEQKVEFFARTIEDMKATQQTARSEENMQAEDKAIRDLLYSPAIDKIYDIFNECNENLVKGSATWIQEEPFFEAWMERQDPSLWVFGGPGVGKSYLATKIISDLKLKYPQDPQSPSSVAVAYFYVKEDDQHLHDLNNILKSIILQITAVNPVFKKHVLATTHSRDPIISPRSIWESLLLKFFGPASFLEHIAFIVIDGLDEAPIKTRKTLFGFLRSLAETPSKELRPRLQFAIIGRPELRDDIRFARRERSIDISPQKNHNDIDKYIMENLKKVMILLRMSRTRPKAARKFAKEIRDTVLQGAGGMFLWAKLVMSQIYEKERESEIRSALGNAPRELDGVIRNVFLRLENDPDVNHQDLNTILTWVTCARRPLLLGELDQILKMPSGEPNLALRDRLRGKLASIFTLTRLHGEDDGDSEESEQPPSSVMDELPPDFQFLDFDTLDSEDANSSDTEHTDFDEGNFTLSKKPDNIALDVLQREFTTTQVVFGHKRIKDYLVEAGFTFNRSQPLTIGVDIQKVEVEITTTLLSVLCNGTVDEGDSWFSLISYASENFMKRLESIDISCTPNPDKARILDFLYQLFHDESCINVFLKAAGIAHEPDFIKTWFATKQYSHLVRQWFREADKVKGEKWNQSMREWMMRASRSAKELLRPIALSASRTWFAHGPDSDQHWDLNSVPDFQIWTLFGYCAIDEDGAPAFELGGYPMYWGNLHFITLKQLNKMAEFGGFPKTEHWHAGLARVMLNMRHYTPAMKHFQAVLHINPNVRISMVGLGRCLGALGCLKEALFWMNKAIGSLLPDQQSFAEYILGYVAEYKLYLGDSDGAVAASEKRLHKNPSQDSYVFYYGHLVMLHRVRRYDAILNLIKDIDQRRASTYPGHSLLVELISFGYNIGEVIGEAATIVGGSTGSEVQDLMRKAINDSVSIADEGTGNYWSSVQIRLFAGKFYSCRLNELDKSMVYWESALQLIASQSDQFGLPHDAFIYERNQCIRRLSEVFFQKAVEARKNGVDPGPWVSKFQKVLSQPIYTKGKEDVETTITSRKGYESQLYGIWLRHYEGIEGRVWRVYFRASILAAIELLCDHDPSNDQHGYGLLARALLHAGDVDNGLAALSVTLKPLGLRQAKEQAKARALHGDVKNGNLESPSTATLEELSLCEKFISEPETEPDSSFSVIPLDLSSPEKEFHLVDNSSLPSGNFPPKAQTSHFYDTYWGCNGPCSTLSHEYQELHFCLICDDVCFCEKCILLIKPDNSGNNNLAAHPNFPVSGSGLPYRVCSPDHSWVQAYPLSVIPEKTVNLAATVKDGYVQVRQEWLAQLKEQWKE